MLRLEWVHVLFSNFHNVNLRLDFVVEMREGPFGIKLLPHSLVERKVKHLFEFGSRHENIGVEEGIAAHITCEPRIVEGIIIYYCI